MKTLNLTPRLNRILEFLFVLCVVALLSFVMLSAQTIQKSDTCEVFVTSVIDGDTFYCEKDGDTVKVRVLGFDAYESSYGKRLTDQARRANIDTVTARKFGIKAKQYAIELLQKQTVVLHRGNRNAPNLDKYGRLLRFVVINDQRFDETMIARGFAAPSRP